MKNQGWVFCLSRPDDCRAFEAWKSFPCRRTAYKSTAECIARDLGALFEGGKLSLQLPVYRSTSKRLLLLTFCTQTVHWSSITRLSVRSYLGCTATPFDLQYQHCGFRSSDHIHGLATRCDLSFDAQCYVQLSILSLARHRSFYIATTTFVV